METAHNTQPWPVASGVFVALCAIVYFGMNNAPGEQSQAFSLLAADPQLIWVGEIWRLVTGSFVHWNAIHLVLNCMVIWSLGKIVEPIIGSAYYALLLLVSAIAGTASSILINAITTAGASAAVFGVAGALIGARLVLPQKMVDRQQLKSLIFLVALNVILGISANLLVLEGTTIDNTAHLVGLSFGFLLSATFISGGQNTKRFAAIFGMPMLALVSVVFFVLCTAAIRPQFLPAYHLYVGNYLIEQRNYDSAQVHARWLEQHPHYQGFGEVMSGRIALAQGLNDTTLLFDKGLAHIDDNYSEAFNKILLRSGFRDIKDALFFDEAGTALLCKKVLTHKDQAQDVLNNCAWLYLTARNISVRDPALALSWARRAVNDFPTASQEIFHTLSEAYAKNGNSEEARIALERGSASLTH